METATATAPGILYFFHYMFAQVKYLLDLMADDVLVPYFNTTFIYILVGFWLVWTVTNIFVIRPLAIPVGSVIPRASQKNNYRGGRTYNRNTNSDNSVRANDYNRSRGGSNRYRASGRSAPVHNSNDGE